MMSVEGRRPWLLQPQPNFPLPMDTRAPENPAMRTGPPRGHKRKAEVQDNERLSKRMSLLNLERNGQKLYVPVESPKVNPEPTSALLSSQPLQNAPGEDDTMQVDDSKHKVYIYNMDDELSSESDAEESKLVFLPDIEKHLRSNRIPIPRPIVPNEDGELAGMQLVLYSEPSSLTVPEEHDSVRKAIIEARARMREKQKAEMGMSSMTRPLSSSPTRERSNAFSEHPPPRGDQPGADPDAMDLD